MSLATGEFIPRFQNHVKPKGFHRIRHYGLLANGNRAVNIARARELLGVSKPTVTSDDSVPGNPSDPAVLKRPCPCCGGRMLIIETFERGAAPNSWPSTSPCIIRIDTS